LHLPPTCHLEHEENAGSAKISLDLLPVYKVINYKRVKE
jgi:hypothetical protein